jgi:hypothetical protein
VNKSKKLKLTSLPGFDTDVYALPNLATQKMALDMLVLLRDRKITGVALGTHFQTGDLSDCFKIYFDPDGSQKPRYRLVFRYEPNQIQAISIEAVSVGERSELEAYKKAAERLNRKLS